MTEQVQGGDGAPQPNANPELQPGANAGAPADGGQPGGEGEAGGADGEPQPAQNGAGKDDTPEHRTARGRIGQLSRDLRAREIEIARLSGMLEGRQQHPQEQQPAQPQQPRDANAPPRPEDYLAREFDPRYTVDLAKFEMRQEAAEAERESAQRRELQQGRQRWETTIAEAEQGGVNEYGEPVFQAALSFLQSRIDRPTMDLVTNADNAVYVAEYLGSSPQARDELRAMNPTRRALAIGRIDAQISANLKRQPEQHAPAPAPNPSANAPTPAPTVNGRGGGVPFDAEKASVEDFYAARQSGRYV